MKIKRLHHERFTTRRPSSQGRVLERDEGREWRRASFRRLSVSDRMY